MPEKRSVVETGKPGQHRHQERRAEHRDDVLDADRDRGAPVEALVGLHDLAGFDGAAVAVQRPGGHANSSG